jgi:hypothetical protein
LPTEVTAIKNLQTNTTRGLLSVSIASEYMEICNQQL